jgi:hypothetical protein
MFAEGPRGSSAWGKPAARDHPAVRLRAFAFQYSLSMMLKTLPHSASDSLVAEGGERRDDLTRSPGSVDPYEHSA